MTSHTHNIDYNKQRSRAKEQASLWLQSSWTFLMHLWNWLWYFSGLASKQASIWFFLDFEIWFLLSDFGLDWNYFDDLFSLYLCLDATPSCHLDRTASTTMLTSKISSRIVTCWERHDLLTKKGLGTEDLLSGKTEWLMTTHISIPYSCLFVHLAVKLRTSRRWRWSLGRPLCNGFTVPAYTTAAGRGPTDTL